MSSWRTFKEHHVDVFGVHDRYWVESTYPMQPLWRCWMRIGLVANFTSFESGWWKQKTSQKFWRQSKTDSGLAAHENHDERQPMGCWRKRFNTRFRWNLWNPSIWDSRISEVAVGRRLSHSGRSKKEPDRSHARLAPRLPRLAFALALFRKERTFGVEYKEWSEIRPVSTLFLRLCILFTASIYLSSCPLGRH